MAAGPGSAAAVAAVAGGGLAGPQAAGAAAAGAAPAGSGAPVPGPGAVLIGDRLYSGVLITLENCLLPEHTLRFTPSMSSGLDPDTETELRVTGCELIQAAGILLRLPQVRPGRGGQAAEEGRGGAELCALGRGALAPVRSRPSISRPPSAVTDGRGVGWGGGELPLLAGVWAPRAAGPPRGASGLPRPAGSRKRVM